jgi:two-component system chemotaxis response regulator CheB
VIGIAISTGGPNALVEMVHDLSPTISVPIVITQHMPPFFTKMLAERLSTRGKLQAFEAIQGQILEPGKIYIAPGDYHMEFERHAEQVVINLSQSAPENSCRPSADVMLRSLSNVYGASVVAIVMTGMGSDGKKGCEDVRNAGGLVIAQDEATSVVWGMPGSVVTAGLAHDVSGLSEIAPQINTLGSGSNVRRNV